MTNTTTLKAFYTYTTGKITTRQSGKDTTYNNLLRRPKSGIGINLATQVSKYFFISSNLMSAGKQKDHGFELEGSYKITNTTTLKAFYTYTTGEITTRQAGKDTTYNNLLRRPKSSIGINLGSQVCKNFFISTNVISAGKRKDAYFDNVTFAAVYTTLKSYILWDIYAEYGFIKNKLKLFMDLRNITNTQYTEISGFNTLGFNGYSGMVFSF